MQAAKFWYHLTLLYSDAASHLSYVDNQMTIATDNYMRRHRLLPHQEATQILDVDRLRTLPKLI